MTPQEAINWIRLDIDMAKFDPSTGEEAYLNDDAKKVIEALELAIEALEKEVPQRPMKNIDTFIKIKDLYQLNCPTCGNYIGYGNSKGGTLSKFTCVHDRCGHCGQKLQWQVMRMTAEKSIKILKAVKELKDDAIYTLTDLTEAYRMAIEALSKQCASTGQADQCGNNTEMVDQFRDSTKMTEDVPDIHVGKTDFQPGNKFILELGQERRMFGEFEIAGTDLYVETRLLEKLTRYDPEAKLDSAQPERKTGRMSNKDWIDFLCEQFEISRTSARDMLHEMMKCKKEDNFKRIFNPMLKEGEG